MDRTGALEKVLENGERLVVQPDAAFPELLMQRWLVDGRSLSMVRQIYNWQVTISAAGDQYGYYDAY